MNYQQTKTIKKYSINKNLLLLGLVVFASFAQACGGKTSKQSSTGTGGNNAVNPALLAILGEFHMSSSDIKSDIWETAKDYCSKLKTIELADGRKIETLKLPKETEIEMEGGNGKKKVNYFQALSCKLVQGEGKIMKGKKVVKNEAITGLFEKVLEKFSEDNSNKNAKIFVLYQMLVLNETGNVTKFKEEIAKVKTGACGVLVKIDQAGNVEFFELTEADKEKLKGKVTKGDSEKYALSKKNWDFIEKEVVKPIEGVK